MGPISSKQVSVHRDLVRTSSAVAEKALPMPARGAAGFLKGTQLSSDESKGAKALSIEPFLVPLHNGLPSFPQYLNKTLPIHGRPAHSFFPGPGPCDKTSQGVLEIEGDSPRSPTPRVRWRWPIVLCADPVYFHGRAFRDGKGSWTGLQRYLLPCLQIGASGRCLP